MKLKDTFFSSFVLLLFALACTNTSQSSREFEYSIENGPKPWTNEVFEAGEVDFTFAIISDLTGGERPGIFKVAVEQLNMLDPDFVLSVGDLIEGGTEDTNQLIKEWESFDERAHKFNAPFFYLGGNHDLTNPTMKSFWNKRFGPTYYHFIYENVLFLMLDSEDYEEKRMMEIFEARAKAIKIINGELPGSYEESDYYKMEERRSGALNSDQLDYFKNVLNNYPDVKWTFVLMHKPLYLRNDEKGLQALEALLGDRAYTVINGHFHSFLHQTRKEQDYLMLGTTGGSQNKLDKNSFDHITLVRMLEDKPLITHLRLDGILDKKGNIPLGGDTLSFQASKVYKVLKE